MINVDIGHKLWHRQCNVIARTSLLLLLRLHSLSKYEIHEYVMLNINVYMQRTLRQIRCKNSDVGLTKKKKGLKQRKSVLVRFIINFFIWVYKNYFFKLYNLEIRIWRNFVRSFCFFLNSLHSFVIFLPHTTYAICMWLIMFLVTTVYARSLGGYAVSTSLRWRGMMNYRTFPTWS